jgi:hypothetical protein
MPLSLTGRLLFAAALAVSSAAFADEKIAICHAGLIELTSFDQHIKNLRAARRYEAEEIDRLIAQQRKGGPDFFTSQIVIQEEQSGSGTFDLRLFHGIANAVKYRNVTAWACQAEDYPIVYFIGFRVRQIADGAIRVSREKDVVNVISLKALDAKLDERNKVTMFQGDKVLCQDIGKGCGPGIFYSRE